MSNHIQAVRDLYRAYTTGDRELVERVLADDYMFYAPPDPGIDRERYFERCWPGAGSFGGYEFVRLTEVGDEVLVTYEATRTDGTRFCNTEIFGFRGDQIARTEVYFGWELT
jgi:hypothetical protein